MSRTLQPHTFPQSQRILVVEDDPNSRWVLCALLTKMGFECRSVEDGQQAIDEARRYSPHVILMDVMMPNLDGIEATRRIKADAETNRIRVMLLSANTSPIGENQARLSGCDEFMTKPVVLENLVSWLDCQTPA